MPTLIDIITPTFLAFREGLEATLVVVILLLYLKKTNQSRYYKHVFTGAILAILSSILFAIGFSIIFGGFSGIVEQLFEGYTFIISGIFIITLIFWVSKEGPKMRAHLEEKVEESIKTNKMFSISILTYVIIIREGIELVLLLSGTSSIASITQSVGIIGAVIGLGLAVFIGVLTFYGVRTINISKFFKVP